VNKKMTDSLLSKIISAGKYVCGGALILFFASVNYPTADAQYTQEQNYQYYQKKQNIQIFQDTPSRYAPGVGGKGKGSGRAWTPGTKGDVERSQRAPVWSPTTGGTGKGTGKLWDGGKGGVERSQRAPVWSPTTGGMGKGTGKLWDGGKGGVRRALDGKRVPSPVGAQRATDVQQVNIVRDKGAQIKYDNYLKRTGTQTTGVNKKKYLQPVGPQRATDVQQVNIVRGRGGGQVLVRPS